MLASTDMFIGSLERWMGAVQISDLDGAKAQAEQLKLGGDMLVIRPEFIHCFEKRCTGVEPKEALNILTCFLLCTIEGRAHALGKRLKDDDRSSFLS